MSCLPWTRPGASSSPRCHLEHIGPLSDASACGPAAGPVSITSVTGSRWYAVNDRPVAVVPTADGGADCLAFDFATGEMLPDRAYFAYVTPGSGKDVDALTEAEFEARLTACRAEAGASAVRQIRDWAHRLITAAGSAADVTTALGLQGTGLRPDSVTVDPLPPGYRVITINSEPGRVSVELRPAGRPRAAPGQHPHSHPARGRRGDRPAPVRSGLTPGRRPRRGAGSGLQWT